MAHSHDSPIDHVERARQIADALDSTDVEQTLHEQFYAEWKAWEAEDPTRTMEAFDRAIGRGKDYTGRIVRFVTGAARARTPWRSGAGGASAPPKTEATAEKLVQNMLADSPREVVDAVYQGLHEGRQDRYVEPGERERRRKGADAYARDVGEPVRDTLSKLNVVLYLENALENLRDMASITEADHWRIIQLLDAIRTEAEVKHAMQEVR